jgi:hypothetical protein
MLDIRVERLEFYARAGFQRTAETSLRRSSVDDQSYDQTREHKHDAIAGGIMQNVGPAAFSAMGGVAAKRHAANQSQYY